MANENFEKPKQPIIGENSLAREVVDDLEKYVKKLKEQASFSKGKADKKMEVVREKSEALKEKAAGIKKKYQEADPAKQKLMIAAAAAAAAALLTAIGIKSSECRRREEDK